MRLKNDVDSLLKIVKYISIIIIPNVANHMLFYGYLTNLKLCDIIHAVGELKQDTSHE